MWRRIGLYRDQNTGGAGAGGTGSAAGVAGAEGGAGDKGAGGGTGNGGGTGTLPYDWKSLQLSPELQQVVETHGWKDPAALLNSYTNAQKLIGIKGQSPDRVIVLPKDTDGPEAWNDVFRKLGRPEKAEDYGLPVPDGQPKEFAEKASTWFHELGIPKGAAVKLAERWNTHVQEMSQAADAAATERRDAEVTALKKEWGAAYEERSALVDKAAAEFGLSQDFITGMVKQIGPKQTMETLFKIGSRLGVQGRFVSGEGGEDTHTLTQSEALAEIDRLTSDRAFVEQWNSSKDPKARQEARDKMARLQRIAAGV